VSTPEISVQDLAALGPSARIVDVREPHEWDEAHVAHAVHVPLGTVPERTEAFDGHPTYVICRSGQRSGRACEYLAETHGLEVVNVTGGMLAWIDAGYEVDTGHAGG
jgi:rhodanese-related sulfurtransferase